MNSDVKVLKAFRAYLNAAIVACPDFEQMTEHEQETFYAKVLEEYERLFPDEMWDD